MLSFFFLGSGGCKHNPPSHELCIIGDAGLLCIDDREDPSEYERTFTEATNYLCSNADDVEALRAWVERKLDECDK